jgi:hypothetical protein
MVLGPGRVNFYNFGPCRHYRLSPMFMLALVATHYSRWDLIFMWQYYILIKPVILKRALFHFWRKWVNNSFVFCAHRYIFQQSGGIIARNEAGLLNTQHLISLLKGPCYWNRAVCKVNWRSWHLADVRAKLRSSHVLTCILNTVC